MAPPPPNVPTRRSAAAFWIKATLLNARRAADDAVSGVRRHPLLSESALDFVLCEVRSPLWTETSPEELPLQQGKVENLRRALRRLNGAAIPASHLFSFWKQIGRATRARGYVPGRQLREGCLFPAVGGGLCQLSNALYDAALRAGCEIVERHPHTSVVPGSAAEQDRDATVAWNYIDLRFRAPADLRIEARLTNADLMVRFLGRGPVPDSPAVPPVNVPSRRARLAIPLDVASHSCASCGETACFRNSTASSSVVVAGCTAYLLDERWPEWERYLAEMRTGRDRLFIPLDGERWNRPRFAWSTEGYRSVRTAPLEALRRARRVRASGASGAPRPVAEMEGAAAIARTFARGLTPDVTRVCVAQSLLPELWESGCLGGRRFEALVSRLPLRLLHSRLDQALAAQPERKTLGEFRAPAQVVEAEWEALRAAERIVTPHAEVAACFPGRSRLLPWDPASPRSCRRGSGVVFPGPTAARKGAYELRDVARELDLEVILLGSELEGVDFWSGVRTRRPEVGGECWMDGACVLAQPALVEEQPRRLLVALAAGLPVITTPAGGLGERPGVTLVPYGDSAALKAAIQAALRSAVPDRCDG